MDNGIELKKEKQINARMNLISFENLSKSAKSYGLTNSAFIEEVLDQIFRVNYNEHEFSLLDLNKKQVVNEISEDIRIMKKDIKMHNQIIIKLCAELNKMELLDVNIYERREIEIGEIDPNLIGSPNKGNKRNNGNNEFEP